MSQDTDIIRTITDIIITYGHNSGSYSLDSLLLERDSLAVHLYRFAEMQADDKKDYNRSYYMRKIHLSKQKNAFIEQGNSAAKAEAMATASEKYKKLFKDEMNTEAMAYKSDLLMKQANKILDAMMQRISYLKFEYEQTQYRQNQP